MLPRASRFIVCLALTFVAAPLRAQTIDDGIMLGRHQLLTANLFSFDRWDQYWEGPLKRTNGNIGTITTKTNIWAGNYGVTDRVNVIVMAPYIWTHASQGVLHGIDGFQDITFAAKVNALEKTPGHGLLRAIAVVSASVPLTDYNIELAPLSIGSGSRRVSSRGTVFFQARPGWFVNGTTAYTWRAQVTLDRPYYYTNDTFVMSDQVEMPNTLDATASGGYMKGRLMAAGSWSWLRTLGGGDIRRQDMPFVSNRMIASRGGATLMAPVPKLGPFSFQVAAAHTFDGRNVGQSTTFSAGLLYTFNERTTR